ncbi:GrpB family protein [Undibacterium sp. Ren11W]|uniref:GrpB family protein n=1 Tax=Undibacterium sp. Ren11W TaxID=3413045 RepID=UPI003BF0EF06
MKLHSPENYQAELAKRYERVAASLHLIIPFAKLEHIGSSSVPGAISKADLDVCMIVSGE